MSKNALPIVSKGHAREYYAGCAELSRELTNVGIETVAYEAFMSEREYVVNENLES